MEQGVLIDELTDTRKKLDVALHDLEQSEKLLRQGRSREDILTDELQHRVRNMLAVIRSVFSRTIDTAVSLEEAGHHFRGRLDALARHQAQFVREPNSLVDLEMLFRDELIKFGFSDGDQVSIQGDVVLLSYQPAELLGLAIHELATNSVKFGALSNDKARLDIRWDVESRAQGQMLAIDWVETGVAVLTSAPLRHGFGRTFIEDALPYQLAASTSFDLRPGGLACRISLLIGRKEEMI